MKKRCERTSSIDKIKLKKIQDMKYLAWQTKIFQPEHMVVGVYNAFLT